MENFGNANFIPPYSDSYVQRQFQVRQQRAERAADGGHGVGLGGPPTALQDRTKKRLANSEINKKVFDNRASNAGGSFSVHVANRSRLHISQRTFGFVIPPATTPTRRRSVSATRDRGPTAAQIEADNAAMLAMHSEYMLIEKHGRGSGRGAAAGRRRFDMRASSASGGRGRDKGGDKGRRPWIVNSSKVGSLFGAGHGSGHATQGKDGGGGVCCVADVVGGSKHRLVNPAVKVTGNMRAAMVSVKHWPAQATDAHDDALLRRLKQEEQEHGLTGGSHDGGSVSIQGLLRTALSNSRSVSPVPHRAGMAASASGFLPGASTASAAASAAATWAGAHADSDRAGMTPLRELQQGSLASARYLHVLRTPQLSLSPFPGDRLQPREVAGQGLPHPAAGALQSQTPPETGAFGDSSFNAGDLGEPSSPHKPWASGGSAPTVLSAGNSSYQHQHHRGLINSLSPSSSNSNSGRSSPAGTPLGSPSPTRSGTSSPTGSRSGDGMASPRLNRRRQSQLFASTGLAVPDTKVNASVAEAASASNLYSREPVAALGATADNAGVAPSPTRYSYPPVARHYNSAGVTAVDQRGHIKAHTVHSVKCIQHVPRKGGSPQRAHNGSGGGSGSGSNAHIRRSSTSSSSSPAAGAGGDNGFTAVTSFGIVLLPVGIHRDQLIPEIERQLFGGGDSEAAVPPKNKPRYDASTGRRIEGWEWDDSTKTGTAVAAAAGAASGGGRKRVTDVCITYPEGYERDCSDLDQAGQQGHLTSALAASAMAATASSIKPFKGGSGSVTSGAAVSANGAIQRSGCSDRGAVSVSVGGGGGSAASVSPSMRSAAGRSTSGGRNTTSSISSPTARTRPGASVSLSKSTIPEHPQLNDHCSITVLVSDAPLASVVGAGAGAGGVVTRPALGSGSEMGMGMGMSPLGLASPSSSAASSPSKVAWHNTHHQHTVRPLQVSRPARGGSGGAGAGAGGRHHSPMVPLPSSDSEGSPSKPHRGKYRYALNYHRDDSYTDGQSYAAVRRGDSQGDEAVRVTRSSLVDHRVRAGYEDRDGGRGSGGGRIVSLVGSAVDNAAAAASRIAAAVSRVTPTQSRIRYNYDREVALAEAEGQEQEHHYQQQQRASQRAWNEGAPSTPSQAAVAAAHASASATATAAATVTATATPQRVGRTPPALTPLALRTPNTLFSPPPPPHVPQQQEEEEDDEEEGDLYSYTDVQGGYGDYEDDEGRDYNNPGGGSGRDYSAQAWERDSDDDTEADVDDLGLLGGGSAAGTGGSTGALADSAQRLLRYYMDKFSAAGEHGPEGAGTRAGAGVRVGARRVSAGMHEDFASPSDSEEEEAE